MGFDELSILPNAKCYELEMKRYFTLQRFYRPVLVFELLEMDCPLEQFYAESQRNSRENSKTHDVISEHDSKLIEHATNYKYVDVL